MSLRLIFWMAVLVIGCLWMFRRPLVGVCLNMLLFPINPSLWGTGLESIRFQFIASLCLLLTYAIHRRSFQKLNSQDCRPLLLFILYTVWSVIACTWAAASKSAAWESAWLGCKLALFVWLIPRIVSTEKDLKVVAWSIFVIFAIKAVLDRWGGAYAPQGLTAGFVDGWTAMLLVVLLFVVVCARTWRQRIPGLLMVPFMLDAIVFLHRRSAFAALVAGGVFLILGAPRRYRLKVAAGAVATAVLFVAVLTPATYWGWTATILAPSQEASAASRFIINQASWAMSADYPMGVGPGNYPYLSPKYADFSGQLHQETGKTPHNTFLAILAERGWIGLALWLGMLILTWVRLFRISRTDPTFSEFRVVLARGLCIGMLGILPALWTHQDDRTDLLFWIIGLGVAISSLHRRAMDAKVSAAEGGGCSRQSDKKISRTAIESHG